MTNWSKVGIIGCGNIGSGFATALYTTTKIYVHNRTPEKANILATQIECESCSLEQLLNTCHILILATKPQDLDAISKSMLRYLTEEHVILSTLAGISLNKLKSTFRNSLVIRTMPNIGISTKGGFVALVDDPLLPPEFLKNIEKTLSPAGHILKVDEKQMDAVTAIAGSGPALISLIIESFMDAGVHMGLEADLAQELTVIALNSTLSILKNSGAHPAQIKHKICSPGGGTIRAIESAEKMSTRASIITALTAAYNRILELQGDKTHV